MERQFSEEICLNSSKSSSGIRKENIGSSDGIGNISFKYGNDSPIMIYFIQKSVYFQSDSTLI